MPDIYGTCILDERVQTAAAILMEETWPGYAELFHREMEAYHAYPDLFQPYFAIAEHEDRVIGLAQIMASMITNDLINIGWIAVRPDHQRRGIGSKLIDLCMREAKRRGQPVMLTTSTPGFYQKLGFTLVSEYNPRRKHFLLTGGMD